MFYIEKGFLFHREVKLWFDMLDFDTWKILDPRIIIYISWNECEEGVLLQLSHLFCLEFNSVVVLTLSWMRVRF